MDAVTDIKARLPIEQLVGEYCQLQKKGRNFVALCPFHKDTHPSFLISPDKGIAYCFACQTGGDIFSFYQAIEGVDFPHAVRELAEKTGVKVEEMKHDAPKKDEKQRLRECLEAVSTFYREQLQSSSRSMTYVTERGVTADQLEKFEIGFAPDSYTTTYEHLLKKGFSRKEVLGAGLCVQKELQEERMYDRFRNRLMFPIHDGNGAIVGFGGRTLGDDDAKYINSSEGILYHKSNVLFGLHHAKEAMRRRKEVLLVEGYFDLLACHAVGVEHVVATSGTALTEQHVSVLKRYVEGVSLCLDADKAGQDAAERAFFLLSVQGLQVRTIVLPRKDASELLQENRTLLHDTLEGGGMPYIDAVLEQLKSVDLTDSLRKRDALERLLRLLSALPFAVEQNAYVEKAAAIFRTTPTVLQDDMRRFASEPKIAPRPQPAPQSSEKDATFSRAEITLCLFLLYPKLQALLSELIRPEQEFAAALYDALKSATPGVKLDALELSQAHREKASILMLFGEEHGFTEWSESLAIREIRKNCLHANQEMLQEKLQEIGKKLRVAQAARNAAEEALLKNQFEQVRRLLHIAH